MTFGGLLLLLRKDAAHSDGYLFRYTHISFCNLDSTNSDCSILWKWCGCGARTVRRSQQFVLSLFIPTTTAATTTTLACGFNCLSVACAACNSLSLNKLSPHMPIYAVNRNYFVEMGLCAMVLLNFAAIASL